MRLTGIQVGPRPIAVTRIGVAIAFVMNAFEIRLILMKLAAGSLSMPTVVPMPTPTEMSVGIWFGACLVTGGILAIGWRAGLMAGLAAALGALALMWDMQLYSNHLLLTTLLSGYLAFAHSDEAWSVSAALRRREPRLVPWWPQFLIMTQLSICYLFAGLSKINPWWFSGYILEQHIWWPVPAIAFQIIAATTIVVETFIAVGLWIPAARRVAILLGLSLHLGIVAMLRFPIPLLAFALVCVSVYPLYVTRPRRDVMKDSDHSHTLAGYDGNAVSN